MFIHLMTVGMMGRLEEKKSEKTARVLLEAAEEIFARKGFSGASVRDIAGKAGVNSALVRYHFQSKEGLYRRVIDDGMKDIRERLSAAFLMGETMEQKALDVADAYLNYLVEEPDLPRLVQRALLDNDPHILRIAEEYLRPLWLMAEPLVAGVETELGSLQNMTMSVFGALVVPFLYEPLLDRVFTEKTREPGVIERRRKHLHSLLLSFLERKES